MFGTGGTKEVGHSLCFWRIEGSELGLDNIKMLLLPHLHPVLINHILFSAKVDLVSELFSTEIHVITDSRLAMASELKHIFHFYSKEF